MSTGPNRSTLFAPADDPELMEKAAATDADGVIYDLEDAVPEAKKGDARENLRAALSEIDFGSKPVATRINKLESRYWLADLRAAVDAGVDRIAIPKVESTADIATVVRTARQLTSDVPEFSVGLETPQGIFSGVELATYCRDIPEMTGLGFGVADYCRAIGTPEISHRVRDFFSHMIVGYAELGGMTAGAPPYFEIGDLEGLKAEAERARAVGFVGMSAIHPEQIDLINETFTPSEDEVEQARKLVRGFDESERDSIVIDGVFLDTAVVERYRDIVQRYETTNADGGD